MSDKDLKKKITTKLFNSVPKGIWAICASFSILIFTTAISLNFAHIRIDDFVNRYMDILIKREELNHNGKEAKKLVLILKEDIRLLKNDVKQLKRLSHKGNQ